MLFFLCLMLLSQGSGADVNGIDIIGRVTDQDSNPLVGATIMITGTSYGAMCDPNGEYLIADYSAGDSISLRASMVGMGEVDTVLVALGDSMIVDFRLLTQGSFIPSLSSREVEHSYPDTLTIHLINWKELDLKYVKVWQRFHTYPSWLVNDSTIAAAVLLNTEPYYLWAYPAEVVDFELVYAPVSQQVQVPVDTNGLFADSSLGVTHLIDLKTWGNPNLQSYGFLGYEIAGEDVSSSRILLAYNEQAALIEGLTDTTVVEYPFPSFYYLADPTLKYILIWDIYGRNAMSGNAAIINMETGESFVFDPTPDIKESKWNDSNSFTVVDGVIIPLQKYHVTSSGRMLSLSDDYFRSYDQCGRLVHEVAMENLFPEGISLIERFYNDSDESLSVILISDTTSYTLVMNSEGRVQSQYEIDQNRYFFRGHSSSTFDPESNVAWIVVQGGGRIAMLDFNSGDIEIRDSVGSRPFYLTPNNCAAVDYELQCDIARTSILDRDTIEEISSFSMKQFCEMHANLSLNAITAQGNCLFMDYADRTYYLTDLSGRLIWKQAHFPLPIAYNASSLPDGSIFFGAGEYLVVYSP